MKKIFKYQTLSTTIYFLFYILISTSGILSLFALFTTPFTIFEAIFSPNPYVIGQLTFSLLFELPAIMVVIISFLIIHRVKQTQTFFTLTFFIIAISHFLLSRATNIELGDIRLVLAAILYISFLSLTLTIARQKIVIQKDYKYSFLLFIIIMISVIINFRPPQFLDKMYVSFAWSLNSIDYLFSKLNLDFIYFVIIVSNIFSCAVVLTLLSVKSFSKRFKVR